MKSLFKRFDTSGHFPDFKHTAKGQRDNKKIRSKKERRILNRENHKTTQASNIAVACRDCGGLCGGCEYYDIEPVINDDGAIGERGIVVI